MKKKKVLFCILPWLFASILLLLLVFCLRFVGLQLPVVAPDDKSVSRLARQALSEVRSVQGTFDMQAQSVFDNQTKDISYEGSFTGEWSQHLHADVLLREAMGSDDINQTEHVMYLDVSNDLLYLARDGAWSAYTDGMDVLDASYWEHQFDLESGFSYDGIGKTDAGADVFRLQKSYVGSDFEELLYQMHLSPGGSFLHDDGFAGMTAQVVVCLNRLTGRIEQVDMSLSMSSPVTVVWDDGTQAELTAFAFHGVFSDYNRAPADEIPSKALECEPAPIGALAVHPAPSLDVASDVSNDIAPALYSSDKLWQVGLVPDSLFSVIGEDSNKTALVVHPTSELSGHPSLRISFLEQTDAYAAADSDRATAVLWYQEEHSLEELLVSDILRQWTVSGYPAYLYTTQYTDGIHGFVSQEYWVYVELNDTTCVRILLSSMVNPGMNVVLDDNYVRSMLDCVVISEVDK